MHILSTLLAATTTTSKSSKSSGSSSYTILFLLVIVLAAYFLFIRPRQQRARQAQANARQIAIGDEVVSAGGIYGRVVGLDTDAVEVEVAPGVVMKFLRRAISAPPAARGNAAPGPPRAGSGTSDAYEEPPGDRPDESN